MYLPYQQAPRYERISLLGEGATGKVYLGRRLSDGATVAIKYLRVVNYNALREFQLEVSNYYRQQDCPFVVDILDYDFSGNEAYLVLEYCQFGSARQFVSQLWWEDEKLAALLVHAAGGVKSIHLAGGFHRDIKPDNLLVTLTKNGNLIMKVNDFGLARLPSNHAFPFVTVNLAGTPGYIAPEVLKGQSFSYPADIFSFGVTIHELFTGIRPLAGTTYLSCPGPLVTLVAKMLSVDPRQRPSIDEVEIALAAAAKEMKSQKQTLIAVGVTAVVGLVVAAILKDRK
jgi:serine/threonine protein kinase